MPIARDSFWLSPQPGMMPTRACVSAKRASVDAIRTSQASASSKPPVMAKPLIAPMIGQRAARHRVEQARVAAADGGADRRACAAGLAAQLLQVEPGAEGAAAPVRMTTSTSPASRQLGERRRAARRAARATARSAPAGG